MRLRLVDGLRSFAKGSAAPLPLPKRLQAWRHGFSSWSWMTYDLDRNDWRDYLPDRASARIQLVDGPIARSILKNKLLFAMAMEGHVRVPRVHAVIERGSLVPLRSEFPLTDVGDVPAWCAAHGGLVVKPLDSSEGRRVMSIEQRDGALLLDKRHADPDEVVKALKDADGFVVTEMIEQGAFGRTIFPDAVNTMRIVTMIDVDTHEPFVASAIHRFGTAKSAPTDNVSRGGLRAGVDHETGELTYASAAWTYQDGKGFAVYPQHPDTGARIEGAVVPRWAEVNAVLKRLVERFPMLLYVGWDVVVTDDDIVLIEGNHSPNIASQVYRPYLASPRVARFLQHHGVV